MSQSWAPSDLSEARVEYFADIAPGKIVRRRKVISESEIFGRKITERPRWIIKRRLNSSSEPDSSSNQTINNNSNNFAIDKTNHVDVDDNEDKPWRRRVRKKVQTSRTNQFERKLVERHPTSKKNQHFQHLESKMEKISKQLDIPIESENYRTEANILEDLNRTMLKKNGARDRGSRFLSLFTVVRFQNDMCMTTLNNNGTCYTESDCTSKGGLPQGGCASGFGVCCYFEYMCSSSTAENGTYFMNPATPQPMCNLMINRMNDDICQIKLVMDVFEIAGPNKKGECADEFFLVTGGSAVPPICGLNSKQHLIYSITPDSGPSQLSVILSMSTTMTSNARLWNIRIYQYECTSPVLAPVGCLQYYTTASGMVQSFNYREEVGTPTDSDGTNHLANLDYSACIRMESGYCGIRWSQYPGDMVSFTISGDGSKLTSTSPLDVASVKYGDSTDSCVYDYIRIPGGSEDGSTHTSRDRFCGQALGFCRVSTGKTVDCAAALGAVISYSKPFVLGVVTDSDEGGQGTANNAPQDKANRGFKLVYNQQPCMAGK